MPGPQYVLSLSKNPAQLTGTIALKQKQNYHNSDQNVGIYMKSAETGSILSEVGWAQS